MGLAAQGASPASEMRPCSFGEAGLDSATPAGFTPALELAQVSLGTLDQLRFALCSFWGLVLMHPRISREVAACFRDEVS